MRILLVADIHGNLPAFETVLSDARRRGFDRTICLGDVVGYGAHPAECLDMLAELKADIVQGNHEAGLLGLPTRGRFNDYAQAAIDYARKVLTAAEMEMVKSCQTQVRVGSEVLCAHGSPMDRDEYVVYETQMHSILETLQARICFVGHTHVQFVHDGHKLLREPAEGLILHPQRRYLVNPGSVGQPRDKDWRTAYAIYDAEKSTLDLVRLEYDVQAAVQAVEEAGLPAYLGGRLLVGH